MERSATEIVNEALTAAVLDAVAAWKVSAGGLTNVLARELGAVHVNATAADLPPAVRAALSASVQGLFKRLLKEGYAVNKASGSASAPRAASDGPPQAPRRPKPAPQVEVRRAKKQVSRKGPPKPR